MAGSSRSSLRNRLAMGGAIAVVAAVALSAGADRALVLAEVAPPLRFAATTLLLVTLLVGPLLWSLERWVMGPLDALNEVHRQGQAGRVPKLSAKATGRMPAEFKTAVEQQIALLRTLGRTNERLTAEVQRRTTVLASIVAGSDAVLTASPQELGRRLVTAIQDLSGEALPALLLATPQGMVLHIAQTAMLDELKVDRIEDALESELADGHELGVHWHPCERQRRDTIHRLRVLHRVPLTPAPGALLLLTHRPADFQVSTESVRATMRTLAHQLGLRLSRREATPSRASDD